MSEPMRAQVAIVDYGMGNLFSVKQACSAVGLQAVITSDPRLVRAANAVIIPGVGAYGDAMETLQRHGLDEVMREVAATGTPVFAICLGMQLLMDESAEFGWHSGLGIIHGDVVRLETAMVGARRIKVPQVGWNQIAPAPVPGDSPAQEQWRNTCLDGVSAGTYMYFVHSFYVRPADPAVVLTVTRYGMVEFCSSLVHGNIFACQFHPERSGAPGLHMYRKFAETVRGRSGGLGVVKAGRPGPGTVNRG